jgi:hypothetical protein
MVYMICIILNNNGFAYQILEKRSFIMCCFHSEMKVLLKEPQCAELLLHLYEHAEEVQLYGHCIVVQWLNQ